MRRLLPFLVLFSLPWSTVVWAQVLCPLCDCSFDAISGSTTASTGGNLNTSIAIADPGVHVGDSVLCLVGYDSYLHGINAIDNTWTNLGNLQLPDGSGESLLLQNYPGSYPTASFQNLSTLIAENWSAICVASSYRASLDGLVTSLANAASTTATAPKVVIDQTLTSLFNFCSTPGTITFSSPTLGSLVTQQHAFGPSVAVANSRDAIVSPTSANQITLSTSAVSGCISAAFKCGPNPTATATATATPTATATGATATATATATPTATASPTGSITNIVVIEKENRSYDNYFGTFPCSGGPCGVSTATLSTGATYALTRGMDTTSTDFDHDYIPFITDIDGGLMDGFDKAPWCTSTSTPPYGCLIQQVQADIPNYWTLATNYALGDNMFPDIIGPSQPNHLAMLFASSFFDISNTWNNGTTQSWGCDAPLKASDCTAANVPGPQCTGAGTCPTCTATTSAYVQLLGQTPNTKYPCFTQTSLMDEAATASVSFKWYGDITFGDTGYYWTAPDELIRFTNGTANWTSHVVASTQFTTDADAGTLPQIAWVTPDLAHSEHPLEGICTGENWTMNLLNHLFAGPQGAHTAVFIVWDESGGLYDHVNPPVIQSVGANRLSAGPRVPVLVVSPYARATGGVAANVIHTQVLFSSIVRQIENQFGLPRLGGHDSTVNDMSSFLNLNQTPITWTPLVQRTGGSCVTSP